MDLSMEKDANEICTATVECVSKSINLVEGINRIQFDIISEPVDSPAEKTPWWIYLLEALFLLLLALLTYATYKVCEGILFG